MSLMKVKIYKEKNHAWCEVDGNFIYGKDVDEVRKALDTAFTSTETEVTKKTLPTTQAK